MLALPFFRTPVYELAARAIKAELRPSAIFFIHGAEASGRNRLVRELAADPEIWPADSVKVEWAMNPHEPSVPAVAALTHAFRSALNAVPKTATFKNQFPSIVEFLTEHRVAFLYVTSVTRGETYFFLSELLREIRNQHCATRLALVSRKSPGDLVRPFKYDPTDLMANLNVKPLRPAGVAAVFSQWPSPFAELGEAFVNTQQRSEQEIATRMVTKIHQRTGGLIGPIVRYAEYFQQLGGKTPFEEHVMKDALQYIHPVSSSEPVKQEVKGAAAKSGAFVNAIPLPRLI